MDVSQGVGNLIQHCGSKEMADKWVPEIASGSSFGTMCLSEPQAGSSLSHLGYRNKKLSHLLSRIICFA